MQLCFRILFLAFIIFPLILSAQKPDLETYFEKSQGLETPRYEETMEFCKMLDQQSKQISFTYFGKSPQGRNLPLLIYDRDGLSSPNEIRKTGRILLMIQACIHPGESEGKDAGLILLRNLIKSQEERKLCEHVSFLFIPILNVDGHERFGPYNRINQNGPKEMGWRTTAQNLNLNRDYLKAEAPEIQAWLKLFHEWKPEFFIDCHTTDGADYQYVLTYALETHGNMDERLTAWQQDLFIPEVTKGMELCGFPIFPYVTFRKWHDPRSGLVSGASPPMLSQGYTALNNRPGLLIETHMLKPYKPRVEATLEMIRQTLMVLNRDYKLLSKKIQEADAFCSSPTFRKNALPLIFDVQKNDSTIVDFHGVEYSVEKSELTGGDWFRYSGKPAIFKIPFFDKLIATSTVNLPVAYIIPPEYSVVIEKLELHGIQYSRLETTKKMKVKGWKFSNPKWREKPYEGRHTLTTEATDFEEEREFPAGSVIVNTNQPGARIIAHLLEPVQGSLLFWGFFDAIFEQKEYAETYVMEPLARKMIAENPQLREDFNKWKSENPDLAGDSWSQLNWFYAKTPWFDQKVNIYPIARITE